MRNIAVIGSGFSGLSCAASLAQKGYQVTVFEKNKTLGGRARQFTEKGFKFDMGPSWYWMPDVFERFKPEIFKNVFNLQLFTSYRSHVYRHFKNRKLRALLEFPVLFLGTAPQDTPALYSLMAYSGIKCGTFYAPGGFGSVIDGFVKLCKELSVKFVTNTNIEKINVENNLAKSISTNNGTYEFDKIVASADYNHVEQSLLSKDQRNYSNKYWEKKVFSPSSLLFYLGINKKLMKLDHHNLFFDEDIEVHIEEIYNSPQWPSNPLFYSCCNILPYRSIYLAILRKT